MYTQCLKCETVFRLSAETLRAAGGQVRCGRCGEVFNALARLAEDPGAFPPVESPLEMETRANEILESDTPPLGRLGKPPGTDGTNIDIEIEEADSSGTEIARLHVVEKFIEDLAPPGAAAPVQTPVPAPPPASTGAPPPSARAPRGPVSGFSRLRASTAPAHPRSASPPPRAPAPARAAAPEPPPDEESMEFTLPPGELDRVFVEQSPQTPPSLPGVGTRLDISEEVRRAMIAAQEESAAHAESAVREELSLPDLSPAPRRSLPLALWLGAAILLALLLCAQWLDGHREWLAAHSIWRAKGAVPDLSAYQLRQWGVTGDPNANGTLRVRASILNSTAQLQPYPLLRVTLTNRFGAQIGARDFEPAEYMSKPIVRMLAPGERADATLDIVDPGKDAEGFEIDVCLRRIDRKISCAGDVAPQAGAGE